MGAAGNGGLVDKVFCVFMFHLYHPFFMEDFYEGYNQ